MIISIDPGKHGCGVGVFYRGQLFQGLYVLAEKSRTFAFAVAAETVMGGKMHCTEVQIVVEQPQIYKTRQLKGDPNDLVDEFRTGMLLAGRLCQALADKEVEGTFPKPAEWKRQLPKEIIIERVRARLTKAEMDNVVHNVKESLMHNVWEGVAIGLWKTERFKP